MCRHINSHKSSYFGMGNWMGNYMTLERAKNLMSLDSWARSCTTRPDSEEMIRWCMMNLGVTRRTAMSYAIVVDAKILK